MNVVVIFVFFVSLAYVGLTFSNASPVGPNQSDSATVPGQYPVVLDDKTVEEQVARAKRGAWMGGRGGYGGGGYGGYGGYGGGYGGYGGGGYGGYGGYGHRHHGY